MSTFFINCCDFYLLFLFRFSFPFFTHTHFTEITSSKDFSNQSKKSIWMYFILFASVLDKDLKLYNTRHHGYLILDFTSPIFVVFFNCSCCFSFPPTFLNTSHLVFIKHPKCVCIYIVCIQSKAFYDSVRKCNKYVQAYWCAVFVAV